jgi:hypothetical protein
MSKGHGRDMASVGDVSSARWSRPSVPTKVLSVALLMLIALALLPTSVTHAAAGVPCRVRNVTQGTRDVSFRRLVAAAHRGDRLRVRGTCSGGVTISKDLVIEGVGPDATLSGRGRFQVLRIDGSGVRPPRVQIRDIRITRGKGRRLWGGGIAAERALVTLTDVIVAGNTAEEAGGIFVYGGEMTLRRTIVRGNTAPDWHGGGIMAYGAKVTLIASVVLENRAGRGGGIASTLGATLVIIDSRIRRNHASHNGGGLYSFGSVSMRGSSVTGNRARYLGGGILTHTESGELAEFVGSRVTGNTAGHHGGGVHISRDAYLAPGVVRLTDTVVTRNDAGTDGGGVHADWDVVLELTGSAAIAGNTPDDCAGTVAC